MTIDFYGCIWVISFLIEFFIIRAYLKSKNKDPELAFSGTIIIILSTVIGARLVEVFYYYPSYYLQNPIQILFLWNGGLSFHGGLLGLVVGGYIFCRKYKINFLEISDLMTLPIPLFLSVGRIANFFNSELYGKITNVWWCVKFKNINGCRHPTEIYESISDFFIFLILIYTYLKKKQKLKRGTIFLSFVFLYSLFRFFIDFFRVYEKYYLGLGSGQYGFVNPHYLRILSLQNHKKQALKIPFYPIYQWKILQKPC